MAFSGNGYEIYGVSVFGTGPVAGAVHVPFDRPITALYGLNGAGKTRLLEGIKGALTGVRPRADRADGRAPGAHLHVAFTGGDGSPLESVLTAAVTADLAAARGELLEKAYVRSRGAETLDALLTPAEVYGELPLEDALIERMSLCRVAAS